MRLFKIFFFILLFSVIYYLFLGEAKAEGEFQTDYDINYQINQNGRTTVQQDITLTNKTTRYYATKFSLSLGVTKVTNVKASDAQGSLDVASTFANNTTAIDVLLSQKIVGIEKAYKFILEYDAPEITMKAGQIWEVNIPRLANSQDIAVYNVTIQIPVSFGPAAFITPEPVNKVESSKSDSNFNIYRFTKDQLVKSGVSASFGTKQIFSFTLKYHLYNPNIVPSIFEIALPPDTSYQKIIYSNIDPKPIDVVVDKDGNWLAKYLLTSRKKVDIVATGQVEIYPRPKKNSSEILTDTDKKNYLVAQPFWDVENEIFVKKAAELKTPEKIYDFVTDYLKYDQKRLDADVVRRLGATNAFENPQNAVCMEFTDLFITLTRAASTPAREVNGFAYSQNERLRPLSLRAPGVDVLHAWPEYWDDELGWVAVDPTWGSTSGGIDYFTKLDFNHFTFVRKGLSSQAPLSAGAYKYEQSQQGDVEVKLATEVINTQQSFELNLDLPANMIARIPATAYLSVKNTGNIKISDLSINLDLKNLKTDSQKVIKISNLPPFANKKVAIKVVNSSLIKPETGSISAIAGDKVITKNIAVKPAVLVLIIGLAILILLATVSILFIRFVIKYRKNRNEGINHGSGTR